MLWCATIWGGGQKASLHQSPGLGRGGLCTVPHRVAKAPACALRLWQCKGVDLHSVWGADGQPGRLFEQCCRRVRLFAAPTCLKEKLFCVYAAFESLGDQHNQGPGEKRWVAAGAGNCLPCPCSHGMVAQLLAAAHGGTCHSPVPSVTSTSRLQGSCVPQTGLLVGIRQPFRTLRLSPPRLILPSVPYAQP